MKRLVLGMVAATLTTATAPAIAQDSNALACARTSNGAPILLGSEVRDSDGQRIGSVSITQCADNAPEGKLRVFLDATLGGDVRAFDLQGATMSDNTVRLPMTSEEIAKVAETTGA